MSKRLVSALFLFFLVISFLTMVPGFHLTVGSSDSEQVNVVSHCSYLHYEEYKELWSGKIYKGEMFHVVGEIQNIGSTNVEDVKIRPTFYDDSGSVIEAEPIHTSIKPLDILVPNQRSPFELILLDEEASGNVAGYDLSVEFDPTIEKPYSLEIVNHSSTILTYYTVFGEILNLNAISIASVKLLTTFYDETGTVICADYDWIDIKNLLSGQSFPFKLSNYPRGEINDKIKSYEICAQGRIGVEIPYTEFQVLSSNSKIERDHYVVSGEIKNTDSQNATSVKVFVTFYDSDGRVVAYDFAHPKPIDVAAGQTATFEVRQIHTKLTPRITSYSVQVHCRGTSGTLTEITCDITDPFPHPMLHQPSI